MCVCVCVRMCMCVCVEITGSGLPLPLLLLQRSLGGSPGLINFLLVKWRTGTDPHLLGLLTLFSFAGWMRDGVHFVLALLYPWDRFCPPGGTFGQPRGLGLSKGVQVQREAGLQTVATCPSAKLRLSLHPLGSVRPICLLPGSASYRRKRDGCSSM